MVIITRGSDIAARAEMPSNLLTEWCVGILLAEIPRVIFRGRGYTGEAILVKGIKVNIGHSLNDGEKVVVVCVCECRCHGFIIAEGSDIVKS